jgi:hypothetical protein
MKLKCSICGRNAQQGVLIGMVHGKFRCGYCIEAMIKNINKYMEQFYPHDNNTPNNKTKN